MNYFIFSAKNLHLVWAVMFFVMSLPVPGMGSDAKIIGVWDNCQNQENYKIIIAEEGDHIILVKKFRDGIRIRQIVTETQGNDGVVYNSQDQNAEEFYILALTGSLEIWDVFGLKATLASDI